MWNNLKYREDLKCYELFDRAGHLAYFEKNDLKDLRSLIDEVLNLPEKEKVCTCEHMRDSWYHAGDCQCQPLTEGEEKVTTSNKLDWCIRCDYNHSTVFKESCKCLCECHKPQESNKDEENKNNLAKYHDLDCSINPCYCSAKYHQEPSKKPSDRIKEIYKEGNPWIDCIIEYLDELHNQRNI